MPEKPQESKRQGASVADAPRPTYRMTICGTGEVRDIYPEHEPALFAAIKRRTGLDEAFARATLRTASIRHPDMIVRQVKCTDSEQS
jgi:hypothetical protein